MNQNPVGRRLRGFTLVELLVVIGIIALLISILLPSLNKARRSAYTVKCLAQQKQIMMGVILYANEWKGTIPFTGWGANGGPNWLYDTLNFQQDDVKNGLLYPYITTTAMYHCPQDNGPWQPGTIQNITSYCMNGAVSSYGANAVTVPVPLAYFHKMNEFKSDDIIFWEIPHYTTGGVANDGVNAPHEGVTARHNKGTTVSCIDGHAEVIKVEDYNDLCQTGRSRLWCDPTKDDGDRSGFTVPNPVPSQVE